MSEICLLPLPLEPIRPIIINVLLITIIIRSVENRAYKNIHTHHAYVSFVRTYIIDISTLLLIRMTQNGSQHIVWAISNDSDVNKLSRTVEKTKNIQSFCLFFYFIFSCSFMVRASRTTINRNEELGKHIIHL